MSVSDTIRNIPGDSSRLPCIDQVEQKMEGLMMVDENRVHFPPDYVSARTHVLK